MNIFDHLIKDTEIIGIGDLNATETQPGSPATAQVEYSFRVYTRASSITIYSQAFPKESSEADNWLKKYLTHRAAIAQQIGEINQPS